MEQDIEMRVRCNERSFTVDSVNKSGEIPNEKADIHFVILILIISLIPRTRIFEIEQVDKNRNSSLFIQFINNTTIYSSQTKKYSQM